MPSPNDSHKDTEKRVTIPGRNGGTLTPFTVGNHPVGSAPRGKRISTWMAEFGEKTPDEWPTEKKLAKLPANAQIALARLRKALDNDRLGLANAQYVEPRALEPDSDSSSAPGVLYSIAAAILALKAAGVEVRKPIEEQVVAPENEEVEEEKTFRPRRRS